MNSRIRRKTQKQMFLLVSGCHICAPQRDINMASPYKALQIWVERFPNISHTNYQTDLILGEAVLHLSSFISQILNFRYCDWFTFLFFDGVTMKGVSSLISENNNTSLFTISLIVSRLGYRTNWFLGLGELLHDPQSLSEMEDLR